MMFTNLEDNKIATYLLLACLMRNDFKKSIAAKELGIELNTLYQQLKRLKYRYSIDFCKEEDRAKPEVQAVLSFSIDVENSYRRNIEHKGECKNA